MDTTINTNGIIKILDSLVADQIAAGEVIERPAAIVKELIENSIDAKATKISIEIQGGGVERIVVIDDGIGMLKTDLKLSVERFGTSKISDTADLQNINTYGFRGEALPSIASVAKLKISTKVRNSTIGSLLTSEFGQKKQIVDFDCPEGTRVEIAELFSTIPARKKFLKSEKSESTAIRSVIADFSLARSDIQFSFFEDGKQVNMFLGGQTLYDRVIKSKLIEGAPVSVNKEIADSAGTKIIEGYITEPLSAARIGSKMRFLVNGRIVKSSLLLRAVRDGFGSFLKPGYYPTGVLRLYIPASQVDVNVHPQKTEVRFREDSNIFSFVKNSVRESLNIASKESVLIDDRKVYQLSAANIPTKTYTLNSFNQSSSFQSNFSYSKETPDISFTGETQYLETNQESINYSNTPKTDLRFLGQIFRLYLLFSNQEKFAIVDMHALHERITFYKLKKGFLERNIISKQLLFPLAFPISDFDDSSDLETKLEELKLFGLEAELRNEEVLVRSIPSVLNQDQVREIILAALSHKDQRNIDEAISEKTDQIIARLACHASLRRGDMISSEEAYALLDGLQEIELSGWCPHGRPVIWWLTEAELEKKFGRAGN